MTFMTDSQKWFSNPRIMLGVQYVLLAVLFLRMIWGIWDVRDLTTGDTTSYYVGALDFAHGLTCNIAWSPIYTSFLGAFHWVNADPYFIIIAHRLVILAVAIVLMFEVGRRLLPAWIAWFVAAWWIVLPINHNALYEVHLFALIPVLIFWRILSKSEPSALRRGMAIAVLAITTVLMRNELLIALVFFTIISLLSDIWGIWRGKIPFRLGRLICAYGIPFLVFVGIVAVFYWRSEVKYPELREHLKAKHTLNVSQIYTFNYMQRHPEYHADPWLGYRELMERDFRNALPTMREAFVANPKAMLDYFWWNATLIPSGLQVALFNNRSGDFNPDYAPTIQNKTVALSLSFLYLALLLVGGSLFVIHRRYWWEQWIKPRAWMLIGILCVSSTAGVVMIMQRPRPSYLFASTLALMFLAGFALQVILHHAKFERSIARFAWIPMALIALLAPAFYGHAKTLPPTQAQLERAAATGRTPRSRPYIPPRPLLTMYRLLVPHRDEMALPSGQVALPGYQFELKSYLELGKNAAFQPLDVNSLVSEIPPDGTLDAELRAKHVSFVIIGPEHIGNAKVKAFMANAQQLGWKVELAPAGYNRQYVLYTTHL